MESGPITRTPWSVFMNWLVLEVYSGSKVRSSSPSPVPHSVMKLTIYSMSSIPMGMPWCQLPNS